jgi:hypothetical protein
LVGLSSAVVWVLAKKFLIKYFTTVWHPFLGTLAMIVFILIFQHFSPNYLVTFVGTILIGGITFSLYSLLFSKKEIIWFWDQLKCLKNKK